MGCILNRCTDQVAGDLLVIAYYATFVLVAVGLSYLALSRSIRTAASLIGIAFGFMPARSAARLDPVQALARE